MLPLLQAAEQLGLWVAGVSFHVGSGCGSAGSFRMAISEARKVFDLHRQQRQGAKLAATMSLLDIGGGFSGGFDDAGKPYIGTSEGDDLSSTISHALDEFFPSADFPRLSVVSEPGRYFAEASASVLARVIGKRHRDREWHYWITDGIYGSFNAILYDAWLPHAVPLRVGGAGDESRVNKEGGDLGETDVKSMTAATTATIFGPTCDSLDIVFNRAPNVPELEVGNWLLFPCWCEPRSPPCTRVRRLKCFDNRPCPWLTHVQRSLHCCRGDRFQRHSCHCSSGGEDLLRPQRKFRTHASRRGHANHLQLCSAHGGKWWWWNGVVWLVLGLEAVHGPHICKKNWSSAVH